MAEVAEASVSLAPLLSASAAGDENAFAKLYALTSPKLFAITVSILRRRDWAEEALQDVYLRIWQRADSYTEERGAPMAWLATIARYRALDVLRGRKSETLESELDDGQRAKMDAATTEDLAAERAELGRLDDCLQQLPDEQRRIVLLSYYEGFSHSELVKKLATPLGTVKSWTRRGLLRLRDCLGVV